MEIQSQRLTTPAVGHFTGAAWDNIIAHGHERSRVRVNVVHETAWGEQVSDDIYAARATEPRS